MQRVDPKNVRKLAIKGGGSKGMAYAGCLSQLQEEGVNLSKLTHVIGTSAGSIIALLLALNIYELLEYMNEDFTHFLDLENKALRDRILELNDSNAASMAFTVSSSFKAYSSGNALGLATGENFREWIEDILQSKTKIPYCTFIQLANCNKKFKDLFVVAFDLTKEEPIVFSQHTTPDAIISDAVRSSISIPFIFEPHKYYCKNEGGVIRSVPPEKENHLLIDGGIRMNYPISVFDKLPISSGVEGDVLGLYLTDMKRIEKYSRKCPLEEFKVQTDEADFEKNVYTTEVDKIKSEHIRNYAMKVVKNWEKQGEQHMRYENQRDRTIYINHLGISSLQFDLNAVDKTNLIEAGEKAVADYFKHVETEEETPHPSFWNRFSCC